ncbi:hypothetical protein EZV62_027653 [Acer yangbiense]|uniref:KH type-2 domain-containing protein n=1 Tax=Acer yangbiense TaxID=1000413 RepID=A0A5C7GV27_9ROSI|nr:hypothetical protein EZV62_027653 [Acer yangbiense]
MKALRALRTLTSKPTKPHLNPLFLNRFYSAAQPQQNDNENDNYHETTDHSVFDSSHFSLLVDDYKKQRESKSNSTTWDEKFRERADRVVFGEETRKGKVRISEEDEEERRNRLLAKTLLRAALEEDEEEEEEVKEEDQKSLTVGIIGAPNAGKPDSRVVKLIKRLGAEAHPNQKRVLCMNKVDLIEKKKDLLKVVEQFKDLPGYERIFMTSALKGAGVKDLTQYLTEQAFQRPWSVDPLTMSEEVMKNISMEVVRERLLDHIHQEIPYGLEHRLMDWKELRNGSLRIEQHLITNKLSQRKILVGKNGSKIGRIGIEANEELRSIFKREVHLILQAALIGEKLQSL